MKRIEGLDPSVVYKKVQVHVPVNVDKLVQELCKLDGSDIAAFYQDMFLDGLQGYFESGELLDLKTLAKVHRLHEAFSNLDPETYGEKAEQ